MAVSISIFLSHLLTADLQWESGGAQFGVLPNAVGGVA